LAAKETILFDNCAFERTLGCGAQSTLLVEPIVFGRAAMGKLGQCHFKDRIEILRDGRPLFLDSMALAGMLLRIWRPNIAGGAGAMASVIYVSADAETHLGNFGQFCRTHRRERDRISFVYSRAGARQFRVAKIIDANSRMPEQLISPRSWML
jgi:urease accessory protein